METRAKDGHRNGFGPPTTCADDRRETAWHKTRPQAMNPRSVGCRYAVVIKTCRWYWYVVSETACMAGQRHVYVMWDAQRPQEGGRSGRPQASPRYPGVGPHFAGRSPGWPGPWETRARALARGAPGGGAVAAAAMSRGRAGKNILKCFPAT